MIFEDRHIRREGKTQDETKELKKNDTPFISFFQGDSYNNVIDRTKTFFESAGQQKR